MTQISNLDVHKLSLSNRVRFRAVDLERSKNQILSFDK